MLVAIVRKREVPIIEMVEDAELQRRDTLIDDEVEKTVIVEYCWKDCPGSAHLTGLPDCSSHFCDLHVHRSADVRLKKNVFATCYEGKFVHF